ncbi:MerR family transcriptional regulator [Streptomyces sp. URMC 125]|uniref:helix-turn-helix domain-containing protein n=1 Tax=Streptomyces sp. URMC 125 TaxID=3423419 RepID=UPI003F194444
MASDGLLGIGELAERAGTTVKTVRFYSDRGLLPEAARSAGGHRRYAPEALERLRTIRALRALEVPVAEVGRALDRRGALEEAVDGRLRELGPQLAALRWREAALRLVRDCADEERADRVRLVGGIPFPPGTDAPARFWRRWLPPRLPARVVAAVVDRAVPHLPAEPTPEQVLAFARLNALVSRPCPGRAPGHQPAAHGPDHRPAVLYEGLAEAYELAAVRMRAGRAPHGGEALDCFVDAYARSCGGRDTPGFRHRLGAWLAADPRIDRYWELAAELAPSASGVPEPTPGAAHDWLCAALDDRSADRAGRRTG